MLDVSYEQENIWCAKKYNAWPLPFGDSKTTIENKTSHKQTDKRKGDDFKKNSINIFKEIQDYESIKWKKDAGRGGGVGVEFLKI